MTLLRERLRWRTIRRDIADDLRLVEAGALALAGAGAPLALLQAWHAVEQTLRDGLACAWRRDHDGLSNATWRNAVAVQRLTETLEPDHPALSLARQAEASWN